MPKLQLRGANPSNKIIESRTLICTANGSTFKYPVDRHVWHIWQLLKFGKYSSVVLQKTNGDRASYRLPKASELEDA